MAKITKELGRIPVSRGNYQATTKYYKDNIVQYKRGSYQVVSDSPIIGIPPTNDKNIVNPGWTLFAGTLDAQDVVNQVKDQETKSIQAVAAKEAEILAKSDAAEVSFNNTDTSLRGTNMQDALKETDDKINQLKNTGYFYAGIATPTTNPGIPEGHVFYIANGKGTYTNFGGINVTEDEVVILYWDTAWHKVATGIASNDKLTELEGGITKVAKGDDLHVMNKLSMILGSPTGYVDPRNNTCYHQAWAINEADKVVYFDNTKYTLTVYGYNKSDAYRTPKQGVTNSPYKITDGINLSAYNSLGIILMSIDNSAIDIGHVYSSTYTDEYIEGFNKKLEETRDNIKSDINKVIYGTIQASGTQVVNNYEFDIKAGGIYRIVCFGEEGFISVYTRNGNKEILETIILQLQVGRMLDFTATKDAKYISVASQYNTSFKFKSISNEKNAINEFVSTEKFDRKCVDTGSLVTNLPKGEVVAIESVEYNGYIHYIIPCKKNDAFRITGTGGGNARLYAFTDSNYRLMAKSLAELVAENYNLIAENDGFLILNLNAKKTYNVEKIISVKDASNRECSDESYINTFGVGIDCKFSAPTQPSVNVVGNTEKLNMFYEMYDSLVSAYPDYVSKINCDVDAGIERPSYMGDYPIYMYRFLPKFTPSYNYEISDYDASLYRPIKVMIVTGTHPEYTAIHDAFCTMKQICERWVESNNLSALRHEVEFYVIPCSGPYGVSTASRTNYNGVDLNRNMPTLDWNPGREGTTTYGGVAPCSEYESKILIHYIKEISPDVFIDHHNSSVKNLIYITSRDRNLIDISASHISDMSRRWKVERRNIFPMDGKIYGHTEIAPETGLRSTYASEQGIWAWTYETSCRLFYKDGIESDVYQEEYTENVETLATEAFCNFLLRVLKLYK